MIIQKPRGTQDILPEQMKKWQYLENVARRVCRAYGYKEIRTPIFEDTKLFLRGVGETTDIVQKEMYTFSTKEGDKTYTLRPENTAAAVRAYLENKQYGKEAFTKWYYIGPMFRHDKPQAGRYRQFHQIGAEVLGTQSPVADAEMITMVLQVFNELGLKDLDVELNSVGCPKCRPKCREALIEFFEPKEEELCEDCKGRLHKNPLRLLDCKEETCREINVNAPDIHDYLCDECREHFEQVKSLLDEAKVKYHINSRLVRGLDYYTKTAFEIQYQGLGSQSAIAGGGRYDGLVQELGGESTPGIGFAMGMERVLLTLEAQDLLPKENDAIDVYGIALGKKAQTKSFMLIKLLREAGIVAEMSFEDRSMKSQLKQADRSNAKFAIILGDSELEKGIAVVRDMAKGEQEEVAFNDIVKYILSKK